MPPQVFLIARKYGHRQPYLMKLMLLTMRNKNFLKKIYYFAFVFSIGSCLHQSKSTQEICRLKIHFKTPVKFIQGKPAGDTNILFVSHFKNIFIYEIARHESFRVGKNFIYNDSINYFYFIYYNGKSNGYVLEELNDSFTVKANTDSFLLRHAYRGGRGSSIELPLSEFITFKKVKEENGSEIYRKTLEPNPTYDSLEIVCKKGLKSIPFSWSRQIDSATDSKFCNFVAYLKPDKDKMQFKEFYANRLELEVDSTYKNEELLKLFKRFEEQCNSK
jgi:hypothetical protein